MFDDQPVNQSAPPANLPTEPLDMFAETENSVASTGSAPVAGVSNTPTSAPNALEAGVLKPKIPSTSPTAAATGIPPTADVPPAPVYTMKEPILGKIVMVVIMAVLICGLGYGGYWAYNKFIKPQPQPNPSAATENSTPVTEENTPNNETATELEDAVAPATTTEPPTSLEDVSAQQNNDKILFGEPVDTDKDGLDDVREQELGTNPNDPDTDKDGLIDGDEVLIWRSNALNPDTDGDGYLDGVEIKNGYNPLGAGKLFNAPAETGTAASVTNTTP